MTYIPLIQEVAQAQYEFKVSTINTRDEGLKYHAIVTNYFNPDVLTLKDELKEDILELCQKLITTNVKLLGEHDSLALDIHQEFVYNGIEYIVDFSVY